MRTMVEDPRAAVLISKLGEIHPNAAKSIQETTCGHRQILILSAEQFPEQHDEFISGEISEVFSAEKENPDSWLSGFDFEFELDICFWWDL